MIPALLKKQAVVFYAFLFAFSYALIILDMALAFLFLGAAFILLGPFLVMERKSIPIPNMFVAVAASICMIFIGGIFWHMATLV
ncbi:hypothetical protein ACFLQ2_00055 [archaeon]